MGAQSKENPLTGDSFVPEQAERCVGGYKYPGWVSLKPLAGNFYR
jgi:hypothetical protein